jgi:hypothetical protein
LFADGSAKWVSIMQVQQKLGRSIAAVKGFKPKKFREVISDAQPVPWL